IASFYQSVRRDTPSPVGEGEILQAARLTERLRAAGPAGSVSFSEADDDAGVAAWAEGGGGAEPSGLHLPDGEIRVGPIPLTWKPKPPARKGCGPTSAKVGSPGSREQERPQAPGCGSA